MVSLNIQVVKSRLKMFADPLRSCFWGRWYATWWRFGEVADEQHNVRFRCTQRMLLFSSIDIHSTYHFRYGSIIGNCRYIVLYNIHINTQSIIYWYSIVNDTYEVEQLCIICIYVHVCMFLAWYFFTTCFLHQTLGSVYLAQLHSPSRPTAFVGTRVLQPLGRCAFMCVPWWFLKIKPRYASKKWDSLLILTGNFRSPYESWFVDSMCRLNTSLKTRHLSDIERWYPRVDTPANNSKTYMPL